MSIEAGQSKLTVPEIAARLRSEMIPLGSNFSYFTVLPVAEEDLRQYLQEPIAALSPRVCSLLPKIGIVLVPYLEKGNGKSSDTIEYEKPADSRYLHASKAKSKDFTVLVFAIKDEEVAEYHYTFYSALASLIAENWPRDAEDAYLRLLREELSTEMHGEVDERSWHVKQAFLRRQQNTRKETKLFRDYARQSFEDTLTLYLHGTCCDIDVDTGPRQMPSRHLRKRLELLYSLFPPPEGYAVFPDQLKKR